MTKEIWKPIPGFDGYFEVSNKGNFKSLDRLVPYRSNGLMRKYPGKRLKVENTIDGYQRICLMKNGIKTRLLCHRAVAMAFIDNPKNLPQINHKDGIRSNNCVENLEWCTQSENEIHSTHILGKNMKGKTNAKPVYCKELNIIFSSCKRATLYLKNGANITGLSKAINANRKYHGYTFSFVESSTTIENTENKSGSELSTVQANGIGNGGDPLF